MAAAAMLSGARGSRAGRSRVSRRGALLALRVCLGLVLCLGLPASLRRGGEGERGPLRGASVGGSAMVPVLPAGAAAAGVAAVKQCGAAYVQFLAAHPVQAKSLTACAIFASADITAQRIEGASKGLGGPQGRGLLDCRRTFAYSMVGLLFFGPSANAWFAFVLRVVPGNGLLSLLAKTALGQLFFGPYITAIFFAAALWCGNSLTWANFRQKVGQDLVPVIIAGLAFWPVCDFVAFWLLSEHYIPPFLNVCSFAWTVFLSRQATRQQRTVPP